MISNRELIHRVNEELFKETGIHDAYYKYCAYLGLDSIFTTDSVAMAARHCASGFSDRKDTQAFMDHLYVNSYLLAKEVREGRFKPKYYKEKLIVERGKPRVIRPPVFTCKVVQKTLCDVVLRHMLERRTASGSYACVRGKDMQEMHARILCAINRMEYGSEIIITDFSGYFGSIDKDILAEDFRSFGMPEDTLSLFLSFDFGQEGLSLGNETSQMPAAWFPSPIEHTLKDKMQYPAVYRYMDDILATAESAERGEAAIAAIREVAQNRNLTLKEEKIKRIPWGTDFTFCKERFYFNRKTEKYYRIQNPALTRNELRKLERFRIKIAAGEMEPSEARLQGASVLGGMVRHPNNYKASRRVADRICDVTGCDPASLDTFFRKKKLQKEQKRHKKKPVSDIMHQSKETK